MTPARTLLAGAALALLLALSACGGSGDDDLPGPRAVGRCSWSYFGDPRSVAFGSHVVTGCIGIDGRSLVEDYDTDTGERRLDRVFPTLERDDHNNPSVIVFKGRLYAFSAPHSGYVFPAARDSEVRYRSRPADGGNWGPIASVPLGEGCGLGYTYPNLVEAGSRLYLFVRGPCWEPYFTWTEDGRDWAPPQTLVTSPPGRFGELQKRVRPYAKYAEGPGESVVAALSDGHPASYHTSLYYVRIEGDALYGGDGRRLGTFADLPLRFSDLDRVDPYTPGRGRSWPMDVAVGADGAPVIVYTTLKGREDTFRYARYEDGRWRSHRISGAGRTLFSYHNSGASLDHADPDRLVLSRSVGAHNEVEVFRTPDRGRTWRVTEVTSSSKGFNIRPVIPRGYRSDDGHTMTLFVSGEARDYRDFDTSVEMRTVPLPPGPG
ncbi:MAG: BNR-4 repeat-containing protein [Solirubrobacteraceae bacterium]